MIVELILTIYLGTGPTFTRDDMTEIARGEFASFEDCREAAGVLLNDMLALGEIEAWQADTATVLCRDTEGAAL